MRAALNADLTARVVLDTRSMQWQPSPSPKVRRKRLDLCGEAEQGRVTSVVHYEAGSAFPAHEHPEGEEILVLEGVFSDEHGDYPAGTYLLHPEGFAHAPFSRDGCVLFVKLRQYAGAGRRKIAIDTTQAPWQPGEGPGIERIPLYGDAEFPDTVWLSRMARGARADRHAHPGGEEIFVLSGALEDELGSYGAGTWLRMPPGSEHTPRSREGCLLYLKRGHLGSRT